MRTQLRFGFLSGLLLAGCAGGSQPSSTSQAIVAGAGYTTFVNAADCLDSPNGVNCNNYASKQGVYMSGGPTKAGLSDGDYYFAVLTPGSQNGGFAEGANGNLSDVTAGGTVGDNGSGDDISNRTFTVTGHDIVSYSGTHATGVSPQGHFVIQLFPYDDTDNAGGVYILAICQVGATSPSACKYDAFRLRAGDSDGGTEPPKFPVVAGGKYYDANANGVWDTDEVGIADWPIYFHDEVSDTLYTDAMGTFMTTVIADSYTFSEIVPVGPITTFQNGATSTTWLQTGNLVSQLTAMGPAQAALNADKTYTISVADGSEVDGLYFGNLCLGAGGGLTLGFWSNKNGRALETAADLAFLRDLYLRNADGSDFDPATPGGLAKWLLSATAVNMANMLSAQLTAMELNVRHGFASASALIYAPGAQGANANGFATVQAVMDEANASLQSDPLTMDGAPARAYQEALKNALDNGNNNKNFVQASPATCPAPQFP